MLSVSEQSARMPCFLQRDRVHEAQARNQKTNRPFEDHANSKK
jgi:hypothetical protein